MLASSYANILLPMCRIGWVDVGLWGFQQQVHANKMYNVFVCRVCYILCVYVNLLSCYHCGNYLCYT